MSKKVTLIELQELAKSRGGKCISKSYLGDKNKLDWECSEGHIWSASPNNIKTGTWCPICGGTQPLSIEIMQQIAIQRGGVCISTNYSSIKDLLEWECSEGHRWFASGSKVKNSNHWCHECGGSKKLTIEDMHKVATERGGKCLSETYFNSKTKLEWECEFGHKWFAAPFKINFG